LSDQRILALFGSTGSIGRQTLDVIGATGAFRISALAAGSNWELLAAQARVWRPDVIAIADKNAYPHLKAALFDFRGRIEAGDDAIAEVAANASYDIALNGLVGLSGLKPSFEIISRGIDLALANKESLVLAGDLINRIRAETSSRLLPVDSEHSAIFQSLFGEKTEFVRRIILTASGGPFYKLRPEEFAAVTPAQALNHPTWKMGAKVTIDSATLMNKGLEVIEAYHLFGLPLEKIEVRIHPVSIVHSIVQFVDGSFKAQLGRPDMRLPIQVALHYPERVPMPFLSDDDPALWPPLEFKEVPLDNFPCLGLAYRALAKGGTTPAVLNGADEAAVERFLSGQIGFRDIPEIIQHAIDAHAPQAADTIHRVLAANEEGRQFALSYQSS
jgi:1-deoxy-D-xylulose-5-phosphate reductoisomerase